MRTTCIALTMAGWLALAAHARGDAQSVRSALAELDQWLALSPRAAGWHDYLRTSLLRDQLERAGSPDPTVLALVLEKYMRPAAGLNHPRFVKLRRSLEEWLALAALSAGEDLDAVVASIKDRYARGGPLQRLPGRQQQTDFERRLDSLVTELDQYAHSPNPGLEDSIGATLNWLEAYPEGASVVRAVRRHYGQPNVWIQISEGLLNEAGRPPALRPTTVRDVILGTRISGSGWVACTSDLRIEPGVEQAVLNYVVTGWIQIRTVGRNGPAIIYGRSNTRFDAEKRLLLSEQGLKPLPAASTARTSTRTLGIDSTLPRLRGYIAKRVARRRVAESKVLAERIAARHAELAMNRAVDDQANVLVARLNELALNPFLQPARRPGKTPDRIQFASTEGYLRIGTYRGPLGIATRPPDWVGSPAFAIRFHRTAVDRIAKEGLAGTTLAGTRLGATINNVVGLLLFPAAAEEVKDDWSVTFRQDRPLTLELLADGFAMTLRGSSFFAGGDRYQGMDVRANYRFENSERGPRFVRRALELRSPEAAAPLPEGGNAAGPARKVAADIIAGWFNRVFIDELGGVGPMLGGSQGLRLGPLAQFNVADDWVTIGWEPAPKGPGETGKREDRGGG